MNSSISNFDANMGGDRRGPGAPGGWRRFDKIAVLCSVALSLGAYLLLVVSDPYDTGRFALFPLTGISDGSPRTANASRGRDPQFNAAVIGNSRGQLLDPARLSGLTGEHFVQLTIPGTGPSEQLTVLHWFKRHHTDITSIVLVADESWCTSDAALPVSFPFPFWLYSDDVTIYLKSIMRAQAFDRLWRRLRVALHLLRPSDPGGYWNYDVTSDPLAGRGNLEEPSALIIGKVPDAPFPAVTRLRDEIADLPARVPLVIVAPPVFHSSLPAPGSREELRIGRCKSAFTTLVASRARGTFLDFFADGPIARDPDNFRDHIHYRQTVARTIERSISKAISGG